MLASETEKNVWGGERVISGVDEKFDYIHGDNILNSRTYLTLFCYNP
jgi:hypothetical protein